MTNKNFIDFLHENSPLDFARMMFEKSSEDGVLILRNWYDVDCEDLLTYNDYRIKINWSEEDLNKVIDIYTKLYNEIGIISKYYDELDGTYETATKVLKDKSILHTYNCFIAPFDKNKNIKYQVFGRVGDELCAYELIAHSQRLCKLLVLKAPKRIIHYELKMFFASLAMYMCGKSIEKIC